MEEIEIQRGLGPNVAVIDNDAILRQDARGGASLHCQEMTAFPFFLMGKARDQASLVSCEMYLLTNSSKAEKKENFGFYLKKRFRLINASLKQIQNLSCFCNIPEGIYLCQRVV